MRTVTKVEYLMPSLMFPEEGYIDVDHRDPQRALGQVPENAYTFRFYALTYLSAVSELGEEVELPPTRSEVSGWYYPGGSVYDLATIQQLDRMHPDGEYRVLASNMQGNGYTEVVRCRTGNWQPFEPADELLPVAEGT
jgi:hypothetical protein